MQFDLMQDNRLYIFSIDDVSPDGLRKFKEYLNSGNVPFRQGVGSYEGEVEPCFVMEASAFLFHVFGSRFIKEQETVLYVFGQNRYTILKAMQDNEWETLVPGVLHEVDASEINWYGNWTWLDGTFYSTKEL